MGAGKRINGEMFDAVITRKLIYGQTTETVAKELGLGESTVSAILTILTAVQKDDTDRVVDLVKKGYSNFSIQYAYRKVGKEMPRVVADAMAWQSKKIREENLQKIEKKEAAKEEPKPPAPAKNDALYFIKILEELIKQNRLLEQLLDTVIPHWTGDLKENNNVNADMLNKQLQAIDQKVECIKLNTRKRGL